MSKYSVLLVDDEEFVFEVMMKKLDWDALGFTIAGYDTYHYAAFVTPHINVIEQPIMEVGKIATERLLERISAAESLPVQETILKCRLSLQ